MIDVRFRFATGSDVRSLHELIERAYRGDSARKGWTHEADLLGGQRTDVAALTALVAASDQRVIVAESNDALAGCVQIANVANGIAYIGHLSVDPEIQARGLGRRLMATAEATAIEAFDAHMVELTVIQKRSELIAWYCRLGYTLTGEERCFPTDNPRFGIPKVENLLFVVLSKAIQ